MSTLRFEVKPDEQAEDVAARWLYGVTFGQVHGVLEARAAAFAAVLRDYAKVRNSALLQALKTYVTQHEHEAGCRCTSCKQADEIASAAIAKAEGR